MSLSNSATGPLLTPLSWGTSVDINSFSTQGITSSMTWDWGNFNWHSGGIVPPQEGINNNLPTKWVEINCLLCNTKISVPVFDQKCWSTYCMSCQRSFMLHMTSCHSECESRVDCLGKGIMIGIGQKPILDINGLQTMVNPFIVNPLFTVNVNYLIPSDLMIITYENQFYERPAIQNNWFKGDPFQLPDVSKR